MFNVLCYGFLLYIIFLHILAYYSILFYLQSSEIHWHAYRF
ncbi:hypothetical protein LEP1GSC052_1546 [Leptospira kmetyi serovar Malaysia str. Bejo-Iso9]|nr:hypothetical protein LEP1GSC052_1546 [Leptospira kmetyi serovar Malaysia str. Bejo-Iso9]